MYKKRNPAASDERAIGACVAPIALTRRHGRRTALLPEMDVGRSEHQALDMLGSESMLRRYVGSADVVLGFFGLLVALGLDARFGAPGDYPFDAGPTLDALTSGHVGRAIENQPLMGSFSILLRAPFVAVTHAAGGDASLRYQAGAVPCLAIAGLLGVALGKWRGAQSGPRGVRVLFVLIAVANSASAAAIAFGHPEEALGAALAVAAVALAWREQTTAAAVTLGLALATKQWAVLAIAPALLAAKPKQRLRLAALAGALAAVLTLPFIASNIGAFSRVSRQAAGAGSVVDPATWWFWVGTPFPHWLSSSVHPAIALSAVPFALISLRRGRGHGDALPILALAFLMRCVLDPANNEYYHLPLLLALLAWEAVERRVIPYVTLVTAACLFVTFRYVTTASGTSLSVVYVTWTIVLALYLLRAIDLLPWKARGQSSGQPRATTS
jgi:hypothetical protein